MILECGLKMRPALGSIKYDNENQIVKRLSVTEICRLDCSNAFVPLYERASALCVLTFHTIDMIAFDGSTLIRGAVHLCAYIWIVGKQQFNSVSEY